MKKLLKRYSKLISVAMSVCLTAGMLSFYSPKSVAAEETKSDAASQIRMAKTEGTVEVVDSVGKDLATADNMRLYTGNHVKTGQKSYAFFNLDNEKAVKLDAVSDAEIRETGKKMEILLKNGGLMLDVKEPVAADARVNVRTSSMVMGIRGTFTYVRMISDDEFEYGCVEGDAKLTIFDSKSNQYIKKTIASGQRLIIKKGSESEGEVENINPSDLPGYVQVAFASDPDMANRIKEKGGMDLTDLSLEDANKKLSEDEDLIGDRFKTFTDKKAMQDATEKRNIVWAGTTNQNGNTGRGRTPIKITPTPPAPQTPDNSNDTPPTPTPSQPTNDTGEGGGSEENNDEGEEEKTTYNIEINSGKGGKVEADKKSAAEGEKVTLTITPNENYELDDISVITDEEEPNTVDLTKVTKNKKYTFNMPAHGVSVNATFEKVDEEETEYKITVKDSDGGTVKASKSKATKGTEITLTVTPDENYELDSIKATKDNGKSVSLTKASDSENRTFEMPGSDVTVEATFKKVEEQKYTVTVNSGDGGKVEADNSSVTEGTKVTLTVTPNENYELDTISAATEDGKEVSLTKESDTSYTFEMPASNVTVTANFKKSVYSITWTVSGDGGEFTCDKPSTAEVGSTISVTYQVNRGYEAKVTVNGTELGETDKSFEMPAKNTEVVLTLTALTPVHIKFDNHYVMAGGSNYPKKDINTQGQDQEVNIEVPFTYNGTEGTTETDLYKGDVIAFDTSKIADLRDGAVEEDGEGVLGYTFNSLKYNETSVDGTLTMSDSDVTISVVYERLYEIRNELDDVVVNDLPASAKAGQKVVFTCEEPLENGSRFVVSYYNPESSGQGASAGGDGESVEIYPSSEDGTTYSFEMPASYVYLAVEY